MFPRWASWLVFIFLGYLIYGASRHPETANAPAKSIVPPITDKTYPALAETLDTERWKRKLDPDYAARMNCTVDTAPGNSKLVFKIIEDEDGAGTGAACGDTIIIHLTVWNATGGKSYEGVQTIALGSRNIAAGIDTGLVGIKPEGVRTLVMPPVTLVHAKDSPMAKAVFKALPADKVAVVTIKRMK